MHHNNLEILPGILEKDWDKIEKKLSQTQMFAKSVHVDFIDGKFVNNLTFLDPKPFQKYSDILLLEAHLMVEEPIDFLAPLAKNGFKRFIGHIEKMSDITAFVDQGRRLGEVGLALDGPTAINKLNDVHLDNLDCILIYTSDKVGFSGPPMMDSRLSKIKALREKTQIPLEADGGVKDTTIQKVRANGATRFVATSFLWENPDPKSAYQDLLSKL